MYYLKRIKHSLKHNGFLGLYKNILSIIEDFIFDNRYGLDMDESFKVTDFDSLKSEETYPYRYQPTRIRHFRKFMKRFNFPEGQVFVDIGSGKGKILLLASQYCFKKVIGVELSQVLCQVARENISIYQNKTGKSYNIEVVESDVMQYQVPDDASVFYLYNPFESRIMQVILQNIQSSLKNNPRKVWIVFNNFQYHQLFSENDLFQRTYTYQYGGAEFTVYESR